jgi:hypothetical protein
VFTDRAPAVVGSKTGFRNTNNSRVEFYEFGCKLINFITHQKNLCAKSIKLTYVTGTSEVVTCTNLIKSRALNHRQFHQFLEDIEAEYGDIFL